MILADLTKFFPLENVTHTIALTTALITTLISLSVVLRFRSVKDIMKEPVDSDPVYTQIEDVTCQDIRRLSADYYSYAEQAKNSIESNKTFSPQELSTMLQEFKDVHEKGLEVKNGCDVFCNKIGQLVGGNPTDSGLQKAFTSLRESAEYFEQFNRILKETITILENSILGIDPAIVSAVGSIGG